MPSQTSNSTRKRSDVGSLMGAIASAVTEKDNTRESLQSLTSLVSRLLGCRTCSLFLRDHSDSAVFTCSATDGYPGHTEACRQLTEGKEFVGYVAKSRVPLVIHSAQHFDELAVRQEWTERSSSPFCGFEIRSAAAHPLIVAGKSIGVLRVDNAFETDTFSNDDLTVLKAIGDICIHVLDTSSQNAGNDKGADAIREAIQELATKLGGVITMQELLDGVLEATMNRFNSEVCSVFLAKPDNPDRIECVAGAGYAKNIVGKAEYDIGEGFTGHVAASREPYNIRGKEELEELAREGIWTRKWNNIQFAGTGIDECQNILAVPLLAHEHVLGVIKVENKRTELGTQLTNKQPSYEPYTDEEVQVFETIANVVSLAIQNARLHHQIETQLKSIAAKAAHRINNQAANYDGIELDLDDQCKRAVPDRETLRELYERLQKTTQSLKRMIDEFRNYGKPIKLKEDLVSVNKIIRDEIWLTHPNAHVQIVTDLDESLPKCRLDAGRIAEAMKELLRNAHKAVANSPALSKHTVRVSTALKRRSELKTKLQNGQDYHAAFVVTIEDDGPGFPSDFPVFEPFHSTDPNSTGLGLATVKELVQAHGGNIDAGKSELGGACIVISIPIRD